MTAETHALAEDAKSGDKNAFAGLYTLFYKDMYRFAFYYLGNREDAEDAVSEAVSYAYGSVGGLRDTEAFKAWIFAILSRACKRKLRFYVFNKKTVGLDGLEHLEADGELSCAIELRERLTRLTAEERGIVLLSVVGGYSSKQIAASLKKPDGTVRSKLSRALTKLRIEEL